MSTSLVLSGRSLAGTIAEAQSRKHWAVLGLRRDREFCFEPWCSSAAMRQGLLQRIRLAWRAVEKEPARARRRLPAVILIASFERPNLQRQSLFDDLVAIVEGLLETSDHWRSGSEARDILTACYVRDAKTLDETVAEIGRLRASTQPDISESLPLSAETIRLAIEPHKRELEAIRREIADRVQQLLAPYVGRRPATIEEGQAICREINELVASFGLRLKFPERDIPGTLAFKPVSRAKPGAFVYMGRAEGKQQTAYGSAGLPPLTVVPVAPHGSRQPESGR